MSAFASGFESSSQEAHDSAYGMEDGRLAMHLVFPGEHFPARLAFDHPLTDEEIIGFSAHNELLRFEQEPNGDLTIMSPTGSEGSAHETDVEVDLALWARADGRGRVYNSNGGFRLPDGSMRIPDAAWVSWEKVNAVAPGKRKGFYPVCPEFVIEVRSENDTLEGQRMKMEQWMVNGAELGWLIDPRRKAVEIYRPSAEPEIQEGRSEVYGEGPIAGFVLELGRIWG